MMADTVIPAFIHIGKYRLSMMSDQPKNIWIGRRDKGREGEGGSFKVADLEKVIDKFYRERF